MIHCVSKQAEWRTIREASLTLSSWNNHRATADVGLAMNDTVAFRLYASLADSDPYRPGFNLKRSGVNPTFALRLGQNTSLIFGYEHFKDERTSDPGIPSYQGKPIVTDASAFFGNPDVSQTCSSVYAFSALIEHDFGNGVRLRDRTQSFTLRRR